MKQKKRDPGAIGSCRFLRKKEKEPNTRKGKGKEELKPYPNRAEKILIGVNPREETTQR